MSWFGESLQDFFVAIWDFIKEFFVLIGSLFDSIEDLVDALKYFDDSIIKLGQDMQQGNFHGIQIIEVISTIKYMVGDIPFKLLYSFIMISFFLIVTPIISRFFRFFKSINFTALFGDLLDDLKKLL